MTETVYQRLMAGVGLGEHFDRHVFASLIAVVRSDPATSQDMLTHALGVSPDALSSLLRHYFPQAVEFMPTGVGTQVPEIDEALEEEDLRAFILSHRAGVREEEVWLAAMIARRSLCENHLWQDLGLRSRDELNALLRQNFPSLVALNSENMKWKKFFYRQLCQTDGVLLCKSPNCQTCSDSAVCFGEESGEPVIFRVMPMVPQESAGCRLELPGA
ncbi:nitrogen fixation protein NifQ [Insolitispirillum peregrinum]|uniref:nitrogen fixation protein NifQ n=1 Tax=Insolitispirillum peregrinum TaxID=80876 RepID=UPI00360AFB06